MPCISAPALTDQFSRLSTKFHRKIIALGTQPESQAQKIQNPQLGTGLMFMYEFSHILGQAKRLVWMLKI